MSLVKFLRYSSQVTYYKNIQTQCLNQNFSLDGISLNSCDVLSARDMPLVCNVVRIPRPDRQQNQIPINPIYLITTAILSPSPNLSSNKRVITSFIYSSYPDPNHKQNYNSNYPEKNLSNFRSNLLQYLIIPHTTAFPQYHHLLNFLFSAARRRVGLGYTLDNWYKCYLTKYII